VSTGIVGRLQPVDIDEDRTDRVSGPASRGDDGAAEQLEPAPVQEACEHVVLGGILGLHAGLLECIQASPA
jgi:hypothetical protein